MSLRELAALREATPHGEVHRDAGYGRLTGLEMAQQDDAILFFDGGRLVVAHVPDPELAPAELARFTAEDVPRLRSHAGKHAWVHVRADEGLAVTEEDGRAVAVEVFPPTTFEDYRDRLHTPAPKFIE